MSRLRVALLVGLLVVGVAAPASGASATVELQAAEDETETTQLSFNFTPSSSGTVTAQETLTAASGDIVYAFDRWEGGDGTSGTSSEWQVQSGVEYTVTYDVSVASGVSERSYERTTTVTFQDGTTAASEPLEVVVDVAEPAFGNTPSQSPTVEVDAVREEAQRVEITVPIDNIGDGLMITDDIQLSNLPAGIEQEPSDDSIEIDANSQGQLTIGLSVGPDVSEGSYSFDATVTDTLGNTEQFTVNLAVDEVFPEFGTVVRQQETVTFDEPGERVLEARFTPEIPNVGDGGLRFDSYEFENVPDELSVTETTIPQGLIAGGDTAAVPFVVEVEDSAAAGTYEFTAVATDSLGNTERFPVEVAVEKPPIVGLGGDPVDLGGVVVGRDNEVTLNVSELGGANSISGLSFTITRPADQATLSAESLESTTVAAGSTTERRVTVSVSEDAPQGEQLEWTVLVGPEDSDAVTRTVSLTATVLYPPELADVTADAPSITFDRPRPTDDYETTTTVSFANSGDLQMDVESVSASITGLGVSATVTNAPFTVAGQSEATATVSVTADPDAPEGSYPLEITVETAEGGTETITRQVTIDHETELSVSDSTVAFGELTVTSERTRAVELTELLGYQDVEGLTVQRLSGPDAFLQITDEPPETLAAGESAQTVFTLQFGPEAELYREYQWTFQVSGERVETQTITVTARPRPLSFDDIRSNLTAVEEDGAWREPVAGGVAEMLRQVESQLREGNSLDSGTLPAALSTARSALLFADAMERAREAQSAGNFTAAQRQIIRAAVARDQLASSSRELPESVSDPAAESATAANQTLVETVSTQQSHYREILNGEPPADQRASAHRALARLATITGDGAAAARHRRAASRNTTQYLSLVGNASQRRAEADASWRELRDNASLVVVGQPLVVNPARFDAITDQLDRINGLYGSAIDAYERAGATEEASAVESRQRAVAGQATILRYSLFGSIGVYALVTLAVIVSVVRGSLSYVRDSKEAALGDFLLDG